MRFFRRKTPVASQAATAALKDAEKEHQAAVDERASLESTIARLKQNAAENHLYPAVIRAWVKGAES